MTAFLFPSRRSLPAVEQPQEHQPLFFHRVSIPAKPRARASLCRGQDCPSVQSQPDPLPPEAVDGPCHPLRMERQSPVCHQGATLAKANRLLPDRARVQLVEQESNPWSIPTYWFGVPDFCHRVSFYPWVKKNPRPPPGRCADYQFFPQAGFVPSFSLPARREPIFHHSPCRVRVPTKTPSPLRGRWFSRERFHHHRPTFRSSPVAARHSRARSCRARESAGVCPELP